MVHRESAKTQREVIKTKLEPTPGAMGDLLDEDLQLEEWLELTLNQPHEAEAFRELLRKAADGATFAISDRPEIVMPWRRTIATRLHNGNQNCWRLTDADGRARDEPQHGTPMGLTCDENVTENSLTGDEWGEYYSTHDTVLRNAAADAAENPGVLRAPAARQMHALLSLTLSSIPLLRRC
eukprot:scaffold13157_cov145-Isochrysis_galbana.AAC.3